MTNGQTMHTLSRIIPVSDHAVDPGDRCRRSTAEGSSVRSGFAV